MIREDRGGDAVSIGSKIKELLGIRGMNQAALARKSGISTGLISEYISGKRPDMTVTTLKKIADALGIHPAYLIEELTIGPADILPHLTVEQREFVLSKESLPWIKVSQEAEKTGITPEKMQSIIKLILE